MDQLKNVKWSADERVDLDDLLAVSSLKDADLRNYLQGLFEPGTYGRVLSDFALTWSTGPQVDPDPTPGIDSVAIAPDGSLLVIPAGVTGLSAALAPNATNYVHAYLIEQDSDLDNRRFLNDIVSPPEEVTQNVATRTTKLVGLYVTSNADVTPLLSSFQTSAVIGGQTRSLVALYAFKTDAVNATSTVDFRQFWYAGQPNSATPELPVSFANPSTTIKGVRSHLVALASVLRTIAGVTGQDWWNPPTTLQEVINARTDSATTVAQSNLKARVDAAKSSTVTVSPTAGRGDYLTPLAANAALAAGGSLYIKAGTYSDPATNVVASRANLTVLGDGPGVTNIRYGSLLSNGVYRDLTVSEGVFVNEDAQQVTIENVVLGPTTLWGNNRRVKFVNCTFTSSTYFLMLRSGGVTPGIPAPAEVLFVNCHFIPSSSSTTIFDMSQHTVVQNVRFVGCTFGDHTSAVWGGLAGVVSATGSTTYSGGTYSGTVVSEKSLRNINFTGCSFYNVERMYRLEGDRNTSAIDEVVLQSCRFIRTQAGTAQPLFSFATYPSGEGTVRIYDSAIVHPGGIFSGVTGIASSPGTRQVVNVDMQGCDVRVNTAVAQSMFACASEVDGLISVKACRFNIGLLTQQGTLLRYTTSGFNASTKQWFTLDDVEVTYGRQNSPYYAVYMDSANTSANDLWVSASGEVLGNLHPTLLPIRLTGAHVGTLSITARLNWQNGSAGTATDTAIDSTGSTGATRRLSDSPFRHLATT